MRFFYYASFSKHIAGETSPTLASIMETFITRLHPGADLKESLDQWAKENNVAAAMIVSGIGSLSIAAIRYADQPAATMIDGPLEIISLQGIVSHHGSHIHMSVADARGIVRGGHLKEGSIIRTTAEIGLIITEKWTLERVQDAETGYVELRPAHVSPLNET